MTSFTTIIASIFVLAAAATAVDTAAKPAQMQSREPHTEANTPVKRCGGCGLGWGNGWGRGCGGCGGWGCGRCGGIG
ncbi:hypothetical protein IWW50_000838, partial [Coemansia erecta]